MTSTPTEPAALEGSAPDVPAAAPGSASPLEPRRARLARQTRRTRLYASAGVLVALLVVLVVLASVNTRSAKLNWVIGSSQAPLSLIILAAAVFGWSLGITTAVVVGRQMRRSR